MVHTIQAQYTLMPLSARGTVHCLSNAPNQGSGRHGVGPWKLLLRGYAPQYAYELSVTVSRSVQGETLL